MFQVTVNAKSANLELATVKLAKVKLAGQKLLALMVLAGIVSLVDLPEMQGFEPEVAAKEGSISKEQTPSEERQQQSQNPRVLLITAKDNARCDQELARLRQPGRDFEIMRARGWKIGAGPENHLQIVDQDEVSELIEQLTMREFPLVVCVNGPEIVRSFKSGCTTPLDVWTFGWLAKGIDERPPGFIPEAARVETTGNYPLRGNHWSIDEDWNPTRERVISHLRGPSHAHLIRPHWKIETWSYEELRSMHDNLHEQEMGGVSASSRYQQPASRGPDLFSAGRKAK
jgi:hypothetical protein